VTYPAVNNVMTLKKVGLGRYTRKLGNGLDILGRFREVYRSLLKFRYF